LGVLLEGPSANRTADFKRRAELYSSYDVRLAKYTRFFAAASTINAVLARLFAGLTPMRSHRSFVFLTEVGAALETSNRLYASALSRSSSGSDLDQALVCAEQKQLQQYVNLRQAQQPHQWAATRSELNAILNERYVGSIFCRWWVGGSLSRILRTVRQHVGSELDFADEFHRISIGLKLIHYIRRVDVARPGRNQRWVCA
jgi:hypothetical protein